jgi:hypothetical protein
VGQPLPSPLISPLITTSPPHRARDTLFLTLLLGWVVLCVSLLCAVLCCAEPAKKQELGLDKAKLEHKYRKAQNSLFGLGGPPMKVRCVLDVIGLHYGPYRSEKFYRYIRKRDNKSGKPWLCFTVEFTDRTLDLVAENEQEVNTMNISLYTLRNICLAASLPSFIHFLLSLKCTCCLRADFAVVSRYSSAGASGAHTHDARCAVLAAPHHEAELLRS